MKITKREKFLLWQALDFPVHRYILCKMRLTNGMEKAETHIQIAKIIFDFIYCRENKPEDWDNVMKIHDDLTIITDHLDKYGYNVNDEENDTCLITNRVLPAIIKFIENIKLKGGK